MISQAATIEEYMAALFGDRREVVSGLHQIIMKNLPKGFKAEMSYGMPGYVVSHSVYPAGYHCDPKLPLPFMALASQKNSVNFYHMGIYADKELSDWFTTEYSGHCRTKLDMGKSCIRFRKMEDIPYQLIGEPVKKMTAEDWMTLYEMNVKNHRKKK